MNRIGAVLAALLAALLAVAAGSGAFAEGAQADQFTVIADSDPQVGCPPGLGVNETSSEKLERSGTMTDGGVAPFYVAAGPGVVRGTLSGEVFFGCYIPRISSRAEQKFTVNGPGDGFGRTQVSLNSHVGGGTVSHTCTGTFDLCDTTATLLVSVGGQTLRTEVSSTRGTLRNELGLTVTPTADGFRIEPADITSPVFQVNVGQPNQVVFFMRVVSRMSSRVGATGIWNHDFGGDAASGRAITFAPSGPVFNLEPTHSVTGASIVDNRWSDPFAPDTDTTPPTVTCDQPAPVFLLNEQGAEVTATVADEGSGPEAETVSAPIDTSSVGPKTAALTGRDLAGNETTVECFYRVEFGFAGFFDPVKNPPAINTVTAGQVVPLNFRLTDASGDPVTILTTAKLTAVTLTCDLGTTADLPTEQVIGGLQNLVDGYYQLNWKTPRSYAGSCKTLRLDLGEGAFRTALFRFRQ